MDDKVNEYIERTRQRIFSEYVDAVAVAYVIKKFAETEFMEINFSKVDLSKLSEIEQKFIKIAIEKLENISKNKKPILYVKYDNIIGEIPDIKNDIETMKKNKEFPSNIFGFVYYKSIDGYVIAFGKLKDYPMENYVRLDVFSATKQGEKYRIIKALEGHYLIKKEDIVISS
jgi:hypothetical protein